MLDREALDELADGYDEEVLVADGLDEAFIGLTAGPARMRAVYSVERIIEVFMRDGMSEDDAREHLEFNVLGAYVGPATPIYVERVCCVEGGDCPPEGGEQSTPGDRGEDGVADAVNPAHYKNHPSGVQAIDITKHHDFATGNVIKYAMRAGRKPGSSRLEDLRKMAWYANLAVEMETEASD